MTMAVTARGIRMRRQIVLLLAAPARRFLCRSLKLVSGAVTLALGAVIILRPEWLM